MTKHDPNQRRRIYDYIRAHPDASIRELMEEVDLASTSAVWQHLEALKRDGALRDDACPTCGHRIRVAA